MAIPELIGLLDLFTTDSHFQQMNLDGLFPFRLVGVFRSEKIVNEWQWDGTTKQFLRLCWARKCYLGVINPGNGKVHRDCAVRCLSGGVTPVFATNDFNGRPTILVLTDLRVAKTEVSTGELTIGWCGLAAGAAAVYV